jgi:hypothetical protein
MEDSRAGKTCVRSPMKWVSSSPRTNRATGGQGPKAFVPAMRAALDWKSAEEKLAFPSTAKFDAIDFDDVYMTKRS